MTLLSFVKWMIKDTALKHQDVNWCNINKRQTIISASNKHGPVEGNTRGTRPVFIVFKFMLRNFFP